ncbi:MAG: CAAX prenyl protease-related protein [Acidobacteria bacterium]|nr:CAAX prenyl protease-related protein [Acidobacteriota bacterium]
MTKEKLRRATFAYVAPFVVFAGVMGLEKLLNLPVAYAYPLRFALTLAAILVFSRPYLSLRPGTPLASVGVGILVFVVWIAPDQLFGYRHHWLFENGLMGHASSTIPDGLHDHVAFLVLRCVSSFALVPVIEELFWRGWMMRWLIHNDFLSVPLGKYARGAFWITAVLFASEHGPYWEVGLAAGAVYNWWIVRTRNLADCILAHAVTNALLAGWVLAMGQWQYWL